MKHLTPKLLAAWLLIILPLGWGIYKSAIKSAPLFQKTPVSLPR